jgi:hypothetical protein
VVRGQRGQGKTAHRRRERLLDLVRRALVAPKKRHATKPTRASRERRLDSKSRTQPDKRLRSRVFRRLRESMAINWRERFTAFAIHFLVTLAMGAARPRSFFPGVVSRPVPDHGGRHKALRAGA